MGFNMYQSHQVAPPIQEKDNQGQFFFISRKPNPSSSCEHCLRKKDETITAKESSLKYISLPVSTFPFLFFSVTTLTPIRQKWSLFYLSCFWLWWKNQFSLSFDLLWRKGAFFSFSPKSKPSSSYCTKSDSYSYFPLSSSFCFLVKLNLKKNEEFVCSVLVDPLKSFLICSSTLISLSLFL
jgi:hypothetical protein